MKITNNILVTDNDNKINYQKSEITSAVNQKIESLDDLIMKIDDINDSIFSFDTAGIIDIIDKSGIHYSIHQYKEVKSPEILRIVFNTKHVHGPRYIAFDSNHYISEPMQFIDSEITLEDTDPLNDLNPAMIFENSNGIEINQLIQNKISGSKYKLNAIDYCTNQKITLNTGTEYIGYLLTFYEFCAIVSYLPVINYIFSKLGYQEIDKNTIWWTSTLISLMNIFVVDCKLKNITNMTIHNYNNLNKVLPLFYKNENEK